MDMEKRERAYKRLQKEFDRMENEWRPSATLEPRGELSFGQLTYNDTHVQSKIITLTNTGQVQHLNSNSCLLDSVCLLDLRAL